MDLLQQLRERDTFLRKAYEAAHSYAPSSPLTVSLDPRAFGESIGYDEQTTERIMVELVSKGFVRSSLGLGVLFITVDGLTYLQNLEAPSGHQDTDRVNAELEEQEMSKKIEPIPSEVLENICQVVADTNTGLTGTEIGRLLSDTMIPDTDPSLAKRHRLYNAFTNVQNKHQCSNNILTFLSKAMKPVRYVNKRDVFDHRLKELNKRLAFVGLKLNENAKYLKVPTASSITDPLFDSDVDQGEEYDVAISFAGEDRATAEAIADLLKRENYKVFYDKYDQASLWGKDLYDHLQSVYKDRSRYCLMIISRYYKEKQWTSHERKSAQARAFTESKEYILPLKLDDTEIPGINKTVGYIDFRQTTVEEVVELLKQKL